MPTSRTNSPHTASNSRGRITEETGVTLAIEPIHPIQVTVFSTVVTLEQAHELVADVSGAGIAFGTWNSWWEPNITTSLADAGEEIVTVHVAGWRPSPTDPTDRAPLGEGIAPLDGLLSAVRDTGYDGWYEIELFSDQYTPKEYESLLQIGVEGFKTL
jgi:sugar phosphate isomerase/epimerase